jgi:hypothetical protein
MSMRAIRTGHCLYPEGKKVSIMPNNIASPSASALSMTIQPA